MTPGTNAGDDWDQHWEAYAVAAAHNPAQALRRRLIQELLQIPSLGTRLVDIGCGQGDLLRHLALRYPKAELVGIDSSESGLHIARAKVPGARFHVLDLTERGSMVPGLESWASHAVCSEVLEHVDDPALLLANAARFMAPGCRLVVTVPGGPMSVFDTHIGHRRHFTPDSLRQTLESAGLVVTTAAGAGFPVFNLYRRLVILRGRALVRDVVTGRGGFQGAVALATMVAFDAAFRLAGRSRRRGWQVYAVARTAGAATTE